MRVLEVTNTYPPADITGVGALVSELAVALVAAGHEVTVLTRAASVGDAAVVPTGGRKVLFPMLAAWRWVRLVRIRGFDLVHVHESDGALVALAVRTARALGLAAGAARVVATLQVSYRRERLAVRPLHDRSGRRLSTPTGSERIFAWVRAPILSLAGRLTARLADFVVAPSQATATELREDYGARVTAVIPNGVAPQAAASCAGAADAVVLYAGRLRTRKAVAVLLAAMADVVAAEPTARLIVAGSGEQREALERLARELNLAGQVRFLGGVARADMPGLYRQARVFCLPSTYEGFPLAILEAMAHGLPVVSTAVAGIPEAVADGVGGFVVAPEDPAALAAALLRLLRDASLAQRMGEAGRARLLAEFSGAGVMRAYLEIFERSAPGPA